MVGTQDGGIIGGIISFFGAVIGGALTLVGVRQTLQSQFKREFLNSYPEKFMFADEIDSLFTKTVKNS